MKNLILKAIMVILTLSNALKAHSSKSSHNKNGNGSIKSLRVKNQNLEKPDEKADLHIHSKPIISHVQHTNQNPKESITNLAAEPVTHYKELVQKQQNAYILHFLNRDSLNDKTYMSGLFQVTSALTPLSMMPDISSTHTIIGLKHLDTTEVSFSKFGLDFCKIENFCLKTDGNKEKNSLYDGKKSENEYKYIDGLTMIPLPNIISQESFKNDKNNLFKVRLLISPKFALQNSGVIGLSPKSDYLEWLSENYYPLGEDKQKIGFTFSFNKNIITTDLLNGSWEQTASNSLKIGWYSDKDVINPQVYKNKVSDTRDRWAIEDAKLYIKDAKDPKNPNSKKAADLSGTACFITNSNSMFAVRSKEDYMKLSLAMNR